MSISKVFSQVEKAAEKAGLDVEKVFIFLSHFAAEATPIAESVETVSGNAELVPITATVDTALQAVGQVAETQTNTK